MASVQLKTLLVGERLWGRGRRAPARVSDELSRHLYALARLIIDVYGETEPAKQASMEVTVVAERGHAREEVACKRAMLLLGMQKEPEVAAFWKGTESEDMAEDLRTRVLPLLVPPFIKHSCQQPESFATLAVILSEMWRGERLSSWPLLP